MVVMVVPSLQKFGAVLKVPALFVVCVLTLDLDTTHVLCQLRLILTKEFMEVGTLVLPGPDPLKVVQVELSLEASERPHFEITWHDIALE